LHAGDDVEGTDAAGDGVVVDDIGSDVAGATVCGGCGVYVGGVGGVAVNCAFKAETLEGESLIRRPKYASIVTKTNTATRIKIPKGLLDI
jgi:hypothetical protein